MNESHGVKCHAIIHTSATLCAAVGAGMSQVPGSDNLVITPIQLGMIVSLGAVFGVSITESAAKAALASQTATTVGRSVSQALVGWIPGYGNLTNALTAFALTESIGWAIAENFSAESVKP